MIPWAHGGGGLLPGPRQGQRLAGILTSALPFPFVALVFDMVLEAQGLLTWMFTWHWALYRAFLRAPWQPLCQCPITSHSSLKVFAVRSRFLLSSNCSLSVLCSFIHLFTGSFIHSLGFFLHSFPLSSVYSFSRLFTGSFIHSSTYSLFAHAVVCWFSSFFHNCQQFVPEIADHMCCC